MPDYPLPPDVSSVYLARLPELLPHPPEFYRLTHLPQTAIDDGRVCLWSGLIVCDESQVETLRRLYPEIQQDTSIIRIPALNTARFSGRQA